MCPKCKKLIDYSKSYCDECAEKYSKEKAERNKTYDKSVRKKDDNLKYYEFYHGKEWKLINELVKKHYNGLCLMCLLKEDRITSYDVIHHVLEIKSNEGWKHRLDKKLLVPLCHACHNKIHADYTEDKVKMLRNLIKEYEEIYG